MATKNSVLSFGNFELWFIAHLTMGLVYIGGAMFLLPPFTLSLQRATPGDVGIVITSGAFQATPAAYGVAVAFALVPHIADLLKKQLDGMLLEVLQGGSATPDLMARLADHQGVYLQSYGILSNGAIITGLLWASILAFLIDRNLHKAMLFSLLASFLSLIGLIHAEQIGFSLSPITLGYLVLAGLLGLFHLSESRHARIDEGQASEKITAHKLDVGVEGGLEL